MTIITDAMLDQVVESLRLDLERLLRDQSQEPWQVTAKRSLMDFQFECQLSGKRRQTRCFDFGTASSGPEWEKILAKTAEYIIALTR